jgi:hypothetical protein
MSIKQRGQKWSLSLYGIDDNMQPQKQIAFLQNLCHFSI